MRLAPFTVGDVVIVEILGVRRAAKIQRFVKPRAGGANARSMSAVVFTEDPPRRYYRFTLVDLERLTRSP